MDVTALWITGLPGSGKSTVADTLKSMHPEFVILRMDEFREVVTPEPSYSDAEREIVYRSLVYLAKKLTEEGRSVIIDATGNLRKWRDLARELIPGFIEVYLRCPLDECRRREERRKDTRHAPREIYRKGEEGWPVPGMNAPYEESLHPDIMVESDRMSASEAARIISDFLATRRRR